MQALVVIFPSAETTIPLESEFRALCHPSQLKLWYTLSVTVLPEPTSRTATGVPEDPVPVPAPVNTGRIQALPDKLEALPLYLEF